MTHLVALVAATPADHVLFLENLRGATLPVKARKGYCDCHATMHFQARELKAYEIYFSNRCKEGAWFWLEDWFPRKARFYKWLRILVKLLPGWWQIKAFDPKKLKRNWRPPMNFRTEIILSKDKEDTIPCPTCKKKMFYCDY